MRLLRSALVFLCLAAALPAVAQDRPLGDAALADRDQPYRTPAGTSSVRPPEEGSRDILPTTDTPELPGEVTMETPLRDASEEFDTQGGSSVRPPEDTVYEDAPLSVQSRPETGGAQTLEDILARQRGEIIDDDFRNNPDAVGTAPGADMAGVGELGALGGTSDSELWRAMRYDAQELTVTARGPAAGVLMQDGGMAWLQFRQGPLLKWGGIALAAMAGLLLLFYVIAGRMRIDGGKDGSTITRFQGVERFGHWLLAGSFIILAITGLFSLAGRTLLIPVMGKEAYASIAGFSKFVHDNISWALMIALVLIFVMWVWENLPDRTDWTWIKMGGGFLTKHHPPAKKFNFGQKIVFWSVIVLGTSISISGLSLLFPFELQLFAPTFDKLNGLGIPQVLGFGPLDTDLAPHEEMQLSQLWHAIVGFALMTLILAHIYIGSVGMEGAFAAMGSGQVDEAWAEQHHSIWAEEQKAKEREGTGTGAATPAE